MSDVLNLKGKKQSLWSPLKNKCVGKKFPHHLPTSVNASAAGPGELTDVCLCVPGLYVGHPVLSKDAQQQGGLRARSVLRSHHRAAV